MCKSEVDICTGNILDETKEPEYMLYLLQGYN